MMGGSGTSWTIMQIICTSLQTDNHAVPHHAVRFFTGRMPFLPPNQQRQSTEGTPYVCAYHCALLQYTMHQMTVLTVFPLFVQTIIIAQMLSAFARFSRMRFFVFVHLRNS